VESCNSKDKRDDNKSTAPISSTAVNNVNIALTETEQNKQAKGLKNVEIEANIQPPYHPWADPTAVISISRYGRAVCEAGLNPDEAVIYYEDLFRAQVYSVKSGYSA